jgi:hypothetical protein
MYSFATDTTDATDAADAATRTGAGAGAIVAGAAIEANKFCE